MVPIKLDRQLLRQDQIGTMTRIPVEKETMTDPRNHTVCLLTPYEVVDELGLPLYYDINHDPQEWGVMDGTCDCLCETCVEVREGLCYYHVSRNDKGERVVGKVIVERKTND